MARPRVDALPTLAEQEMIDEDLSQLTGDEIAGGWRSICAMILLRTVSSATRSQSARVGKAEVLLQWRSAQRWLAGQDCLVTFNDVLSALDLEKQYVLKGIDRYAQRKPDESIITSSDLLSPV
jgi:hypothetical protein